MMFVISILLFLAFSLSALFIGYVPNGYNLFDRDMQNKAYENAELEGVRLGDVLLRAGTMDTASNITTLSNIPFTYNNTTPLLELQTKITVGMQAISLTSSISSMRITADVVKQ